ncbi:hypothetical protein ACTI_67490 [Actinoplanes sp. OR16]|uniref:DsbA family protein n=1 Tax=Actinoplanes sp. OR16 TaxID=946334 RepID=UPI000F6BBE97|nr:thioredoxin domain-containing protein [Actinoplanes sp. OR16]BBH70064.1 hypothetical protein ACTI_67490 [Actinoplanes sp. OR16]
MRTSRSQARQQVVRRRNKRLGIAAVAVVAFLGVVLTAQFTGNPGPSATPASSAGPAGMTRPGQNAAMTIGDPAAPVVMVQWTDMRCPFCAVFNRETLPVLRREYVDTGKIRIEIRDVAFFGAESEDGAVAARAAAMQGRFFEFLTALYAGAPDSGHPDLPREKLIAFAHEAGVPDIPKFTADLDRPGLRVAARASNAEAARLGVGSVPFFLAGDKTLSGAQPITVFRSYLDDAIAAAG